MVKLSLAITTYNRTELLFKSFAKVITDPRIDEVVIVDDASDHRYFNTILTKLNDIPKVRLHRNNKNLGVYHNKYQSVKLSRNDYVIIFDSDNIIDKPYLDALYKLASWDNQTVYTPSFAKPEFDYRHMAGQLISRKNVSRFFREKRFDCLINTMNCMVNRQAFISVYNRDIEPAAADSAYFNYRWLDAGYFIEVVPGMEYEHLVHNGSHYKQTIGTSNRMHAHVLNLLKNMS